MILNKRISWQVVISVCILALLCITVPLVSAENNQVGYVQAGSTDVSGPVPNPYLAAPLYALTHFDSSQSDSTNYGPPKGVFTIDLKTEPIVYGGPVNGMTLVSTDKNYMWAVGSDRVTYVDISGENLKAVASFEALANATANALPAIPDENFRKFGESSAVGMNATSMDRTLQELFNVNYGYRLGNGGYPVVDNENTLYSNYGKSLYAFVLKNPANPTEGIIPRAVIQDVLTSIQGENYPKDAQIRGLSMTYDGFLIILFTNGVAVIPRNLDTKKASFYPFGDDEIVYNSLAVDEKNGLYVASDKIMHKLVWNGTALSDAEADGAWTSPYTYSTQPPIIKFGSGTGSTPTLMGVGNNKDKLVVITDGAKHMNLVAFWRDNIPKNGTRIAGQIPVTCGFSPLPEWIQSEQSVTVKGYGAFVVNNIPLNISSDLIGKNKILQVSLMGPAYETSYGVERFLWNTTEHKWESVWARSDVSSTSMIPIHCDAGNMAVINGYRSPKGWEVLGLDWNTGKTVHQTIFGNINLGNGGYAILQYLEDGDLLFNEFTGPVRVHYDPQGVSVSTQSTKNKQAIKPTAFTVKSVQSTGLSLANLSNDQPSTSLMLDPGVILVSFQAKDPQKMRFNQQCKQSWGEFSDIRMTSPYDGSLAYGIPAKDECLVNISGSGTWTAQISRFDMKTPLKMPVNLSGSGTMVSPSFTLEKGNYIFQREETGTASPVYELMFSNGSQLMNMNNTFVQPNFSRFSPETFRIINIPKSGTYFLSVIAEDNPKPWNVSIISIPKILGMGPGPAIIKKV